jgi:hypothetical protein
MVSIDPVSILSHCLMPPRCVPVLVADGLGCVVRVVWDDLLLKS